MEYEVTNMDAAAFGLPIKLTKMGRSDTAEYLCREMRAVSGGRVSWYRQFKKQLPSNFGDA